jgi:peptidoglycan/LPS O-acetylase OafA/YrhL
MAFGRAREIVGGRGVSPSIAGGADREESPATGDAPAGRCANGGALVAVPLRSPVHGVGGFAMTATAGRERPLAYRPDIDGLRAIAVLSVFAFHTNLGLFGGGYVGVDIFFVISGYLISRMIFQALNEGRFSVVRFYRRRIRRIVPALLAVTLVVLAVSLLYLYPVEIIDLAKSAMAAAWSLSNVYFWRSASYFDAPANSKPLLHTWSLGVEEQFYIVFPLLMAAIGRGSTRTRLAVIVGLALISFGVSTFLTATNPDSAFYLPQSRAWELMIGALVATGVARPPERRVLREVIAGAGLIVIAYAILRFKETTPFPGVAALAPCLGAGVLIWIGSAGSETVVGRVLRSRPFVAVGLISYSLYLWHWPMIVFQRVGQFIHTGASPVADKAFVALLTFGVAYLSWRFVERPFRRDDEKPSAVLFGWGAAACGLVCFLSFGVLAAGGLPRRFSPEAVRLASFLNHNPALDMRNGVCFLQSRTRFVDFESGACLRRTPGRPSYMLIGDSHADHLFPGLRDAYGAHADVLEATATGCKPLLADEGTSTPCAQMTRFIYEDYLRNHPVDLLLISARWGAEDLPDIAATISGLKARGIRTVVIGPTPEYDFRLPRLLARAADGGGEVAERGHLLPQYRALDGELRRTIAASGVGYVSPYQALCNDTGCAALVGDAPLFYDTGHLTQQGSILLVNRLKGAIAAAASIQQ